MNPPVDATGNAVPAAAAPAAGSPASSPRRRLPWPARYTWARHWPAEALMGVSTGVSSLADFTALRSLGAPAWTPQLLVVGQVLWLFAPAWPPLLARLDRRRAFAWIGWMSKGPLLLIALITVTSTGSEGRGVGDWAMFVSCVLLSTAIDSVYTPHRNALLKANYPLEVRGRVYGLVSAVTYAASTAAALLVSPLIDQDARWVRVVFPAAAVCGIVAHLLLARIRWRHEKRPPAGAQALSPVDGAPPAAVPVRAALSDAWRRSKATLAKDRRFLDFEVAFMLYGLGLLLATPLIPTFAERDLNVSTSEWATAQRVVFPLTQLFLLPLVGRLCDRLGLFRVTGLSFAALVAFFLAMTQVGGAAGLIVSFAVYGVAMAGVNLGWSLGPLHFAPPGEAHHYTSIHVSMVGIRSVVGPPLGYGVAKALSPSAAFLLAAAFEAAGAVLMVRIAKRTAGA
jgi:MFS family permease